MARFILVSAVLALLSACSNEIIDLKSPCSGAEGSPCDTHPVNDWWLG